MHWTGARAWSGVKEAYTHLEEFFGADERVANITRARIDAYAVARLAERKRATVNNELAQLRRGFQLAIEAGQLAVMPVFKLPNPHNARSGFFEEGEFAAVLLELPGDARRDLVEFLRATGWRRDEARLLQWAAVDVEGGIIRLEEARAKSGKPRLFPFGLAPSLKALLARRWTARDGLYVFQIDGRPIGVQALRYAWRRATKRAGLAGRLVHDLRRSAARDFRRAGVSEGEIMQLCGWRTRAMFDRYNIIDEADLAAAVAKRYGQVAGKSAPSTTPGESVSSSAA
jgi:integrase